VNREELLAAFKTWFQKFRGTLWFRITYLVLLGVIVGELYVLTLSSIACLALLLMPVSLFVVPYWLGERKLRRFGANLLVVMFIAVLLAAAMSTQALLAQAAPPPLVSVPGFDSDPTMILANGTVTPYRAPPSTPFTFRVKLTTTVDGTPSQYNVSLNLTTITGLTGVDRHSYPMQYSPENGSSNNTRNGTWYATTRPLPEAIYGFGFAVRNPSSNWTSAGIDLGPLTASGWTFFGFFVYATALSQVTILAVIAYFAILFLWWFTIRQREARAKALARAGESPKTAAKETPKESPKSTTSSTGGKAGKVAAFTCTNCGADVDETDLKCPKCGAAFED
jgi:hypothetical protein